jgi:hypothetical protein
VRQYRAEVYAQEQGIPLADALRLFEAQAAAREVIAELEATSPDRLAGVWVEKTPERRLVAWYTGGDAPQEALDIALNSPIPVEIRTGAARTLRELVDVSDAIGESLGPGARLGGRWVEVQTNTVHVRLQPDSPLDGDADRLSSELSTDFGANVLVTVASEQAGDNDVYGGIATTPVCTAGFTVYHWPLQATGIVTAGHCEPNTSRTLSHGTGHGMTFNEELRTQIADAEWWSVATTEFNWFWTSAYGYIEVEDYLLQGEQAVGDDVCHHGKATGTSCGELISKTYAPEYDDACPGTCLSTWMLVDGGSYRERGQWRTLVFR